VSAAEEHDEPDAENVEEADLFNDRPRACRETPCATEGTGYAERCADRHECGSVRLHHLRRARTRAVKHKKYMIAAAWLKDHRNTDGVTADHILHVFPSMSWPTNIPDFWQPLRDLKAKRYFTKNDKGEYEINHLGIDFVKNLGGANGAG
jgi:hypothetical protein